jgi:hypothetical protein
LLSRWVNLTAGKRQELNQLFALNRKVFKAYLLKESLDRLWTYRYEGAMLNYLQRWIDQLRWQRLEPFQKLALMLLDHLDGILNYCRTKVPLGVVEAVNGNIKSLLRRGRGYKNLRYLLLKAQRMAAIRKRICRLQESSLQCGSWRIPAENLNLNGTIYQILCSLAYTDSSSWKKRKKLAWSSMPRKGWVCFTGSPE